MPTALIEASNCSSIAGGTVVLTIVFLVIFGEVIPKKIGQDYSLRVIKLTVCFIDIIDFFFGWLGVAFISITDISSWVGSMLSKLRGKFCSK